jgi:hypothetical protein
VNQLTEHHPWDLLAVDTPRKKHPGDWVRHCDDTLSWGMVVGRWFVSSDIHMWALVLWSRTPRKQR